MATKITTDLYERDAGDYLYWQFYWFMTKLLGIRDELERG